MRAIIACRVGVSASPLCHLPTISAFEGRPNKSSSSPSTSTTFIVPAALTVSETGDENALEGPFTPDAGSDAGGTGSVEARGLREERSALDFTCAQDMG